MPTTVPSVSTTGPPESPGWMFAASWIRPSMVCAFEPSLSEAVISCSSAVTRPETTVGVPPRPPALPRATTDSPTESESEEPTRAAVKPETFWTWIRATSSTTLYPRTFAGRVTPVAASSTVRPVDPAITWLFVSTRPELEMTIPVPAAWPPFSIDVLMLTTASSTWAATAFTSDDELPELDDPVPGKVEDPLEGNGDVPS